MFQAFAPADREKTLKEPAMAPMYLNRPNTLRLSALALAALSLAPLPGPSAAQTVYREYEDGGLEPWSDEEIRNYSAAPLRRRPPRAFNEDDDERFERDDEDGDEFDDDDRDDRDDDDRQGTLDLAPANPSFERREIDRLGANIPATNRKAPAPPPSVDAKPADDAWKPAHQTRGRVTAARCFPPRCHVQRTA